MEKRIEFIASSRDHNSIRKDAYRLRKMIGLEKTLKFPIVEFIEHVLPEIFPGFDYEIVPDSELPGRMAEMDTYNLVLTIRQSVYEAACAGSYKARMVLAHEVGHLLYHQPDSIRYAKLDYGQKIPNRLNPEKQADYFAAALLIPMNLTKGMGKHAIASRCGVSITAATHHIEERERMERRKKDKKRESTAKRNTRLPKD